MDTASGRTLEVATLGGGCFWCLEAAFVELQGVERVVSGYAGGTVANPSYRQVCSGATGHAEVIQLTFDPQQLSFAEVLEVFFTIHDPTTLNRQGHDVGTQYRSIVLYHTPEQQRTTLATIEKLSAQGLWRGKVVTEVVPFTVFYPAEEYHQRYFENNPEQAYCQAVVAPKVAKVRQRYATRLRDFAR